MAVEQCTNYDATETTLQLLPHTAPYELLRAKLI